MKLILLSGGSGKRLWPLSNDARSKQFLKVLTNNDNQLESMVQRVWRQINSAGLTQDTIIATSASQKEILEKQLNDNVNIVVEPSRRDTFPAIVLASLYLKDVNKCSLDEHLVVSSVDSYVDASYFEEMKKLPILMEETKTELSLMGVTPTEPTEKFGYILPNIDSDRNLVDTFIEKPKKDKAEILIEKGALWNCGVFSFKLKMIVDYLERCGLPTNYYDALENYFEFPRNSFDYELVEKINDISVLEYQGFWKDLGTWNSLSDEINGDSIGIVSMANPINNVKVINELDIPIITIGLKNIIVAASPDGILVSDKEESENLKRYVDEFQSKPMYEERNWGSFKTLDYTKHGHVEVVTKRLLVNEGKVIHEHYHKKRKEIWTILSGEAEVILDNIPYIIGTGQTIEVLPNIVHSLKAITDCSIIEVQHGEILKQDIYTKIKEYW